MSCSFQFTSKIQQEKRKPQFRVFCHTNSAVFDRFSSVVNDEIAKYSKSTFTYFIILYYTATIYLIRKNSINVVELDEWELKLFLKLKPTRKLYSLQF